MGEKGELKPKESIHPETYVMLSLGSVSVILSDNVENPMPIKELSDLAWVSLNKLYEKAKCIPGLT